MGLDSLVRSGVSIAKGVTSDLQDAITLAPWTGQGNYGEPTYGSGVSYDALVEHRQKLVTDFDGNEVLSTTTVTVLKPITATVATGRRNPVDPRDKLTLPDGNTAPILAERGLVDPSTSAPYMHEIHVGAA